MRTLTLLAIFLVVAGCGKRREKTSNVFKQESGDYIFNVAVGEKAAKDPRVGEFILRALDTFFQDRVGTGDLVIVTRVEGKRVLAWMGTPRQLRQDFTPQSFQATVLNSERELGSLYDGLSRSLNMLMDTAGEGKTKAVTVVASDMNDPQANTEADARFIETLIKYHQKGGQIGFYFCDELRMDEIKEKTKKAGMGWSTILPDPYGRPGVPRFD